MSDFKIREAPLHIVEIPYLPHGHALLKKIATANNSGMGDYQPDDGGVMEPRCFFLHMSDATLTLMGIGGLEYTDEAYVVILFQRLRSQGIEGYVLLHYENEPQNGSEKEG